MTMPVLFVGHGSPENVLKNNPYTQALQKLGKTITPRPKFIVVISAHWVTSKTRVLTEEHPSVIHDFYGFPQALYQFQYLPLGASAQAQRLANQLNVSIDKEWGLDHGAWSVLAHLYPDASIPVFQLSIDNQKSFLDHLQLGKQLKFLREEGALILGSGNLTHNLQHLSRNIDAEPSQWAQVFDQKAQTALQLRDEYFLVHPDAWGSELFRQAHPTHEHYIPLLYVLGASTQNDQLYYPYEGFEYGTLSMRMVLFQ